MKVKLVDSGLLQLATVLRHLCCGMAGLAMNDRRERFWSTGKGQGQRLQNDILGPFISFQPQKDRLTNLAVICPFRKFDLGYQGWLNPRAPLHDCRGDVDADFTGLLGQQEH